MEKQESPPQRSRLFPLMLGLVGFLFVRGCLLNMSSNSISFSEYKTLLDKGQIKSVTILGNRIRGQFKNPVNGKIEFETNYVAPPLSEELEKKGVVFESSGDTTAFTNFLAFLLPTFLLIGF